MNKEELKPKDVGEIIEKIASCYDRRRIEVWNIKNLDEILDFFQKEIFKEISQELSALPVFCLNNIFGQLLEKYKKRKYDPFNFGIFLSSLINKIIQKKKLLGENKVLEISLDLREIPDLKGVACGIKKKVFLTVLGNVGDFFAAKIEGGKIILKGSAKDLAGKGMKSGKIRVEGNVGDWLAEGMLGGEIIVEGSTGRWAGKEMKDGILILSEKVSSFDRSIFSSSNKGVVIWQEEKIFEKGKLTEKGEILKMEGKMIFD